MQISIEPYICTKAKNLVSNYILDMWKILIIKMNGI